MLPTSHHLRVAKVNGSKPRPSTETRLSASSAATSARVHGCRLMQGRVTSRGAKVVKSSSTLSTSGWTPTKVLKRIRPLMIMGSPIWNIFARPANRESAFSDPWSHCPSKPYFFNTNRLLGGYGWIWPEISVFFLNLCWNNWWKKVTRRMKIGMTTFRNLAWIILFKSVFKLKS